MRKYGDIFEMPAKYDSRKSFYGKAEVLETEDGGAILYSYGHKVAAALRGAVTIFSGVRMAGSQTTTRHIVEFVKQYGAVDLWEDAKLGGQKFLRKYKAAGVIEVI